MFLFSIHFKKNARRLTIFERKRNLTLCLNKSKVFKKLSKSRIHYLSDEMCTFYPFVFKKPEVVSELRRLHDNFVLVPANKASNDIVLVCIEQLSPLIYLVINKRCSA
jgi:hypothetical protein